MDVTRVVETLSTDDVTVMSRSEKFTRHLSVSNCRCSPHPVVVVDLP